MSGYYFSFRYRFDDLLFSQITSRNNCPAIIRTGKRECFGRLQLTCKDPSLCSGIVESHFWESNEMFLWPIDGLHPVFGKGYSAHYPDFWRDSGRCVAPSD